MRLPGSARKRLAAGITGITGKTRINVDSAVAEAVKAHDEAKTSRMNGILHQLIKGHVRDLVAEQQGRHASEFEEGNAAKTVREAIREAQDHLAETKRLLGSNSVSILGQAPYVSLRRWLKTAETVAPHAGENALGHAAYSLAQRLHEHEGQMLRTGWSDRIVWEQLREFHGATDSALHEIASRELKLNPPQTVADAKTFNEKLEEARDRIWKTAHAIGNQGTTHEPVDLKTIGLGERQGTLYDLVVRPEFWRAVAQSKEEPPGEKARWTEITAWAKKMRAQMPSA